MGFVVSDASTLIHLANIGLLGVLKQFFAHVAVPPAVWTEVVVHGEGRPGAVEVEKAASSGWLTVETPGNRVFVRALCRDLDEGEAEAIALAAEKSASLILLDETEARRVADAYGVPKTRIIGLLIRAKREKVIELLKPELDRLVHQSGFWIDRGLYEHAFDSVGERAQ
jgi:uncharacterized protein